MVIKKREIRGIRGPVKNAGIKDFGIHMCPCFGVSLFSASVPHNGANFPFFLEQMGDFCFEIDPKEGESLFRNCQIVGDLD